VTSWPLLLFYSYFCIGYLYHLLKSGGSKWRPEAKANKNKNAQATGEGEENIFKNEE